MDHQPPARGLIERFAARLTEAVASRSAISPLTGEYPFTVEEAYDIQEAVLARATGAGESIVAAKLRVDQPGEAGADGGVGGPLRLAHQPPPAEARRTPRQRSAHPAASRTGDRLHHITASRGTGGTSRCSIRYRGCSAGTRHPRFPLRGLRVHVGRRGSRQLQRRRVRAR